MKEEWLFPGAMVPVDMETTAALVAEIKRLIDVVGGMVLAQPEQEPFGYVSMYDNPIFQKEKPEIGRWETVYTASPKREWVGLTDDEIDEWTPEIHTVIKAIEAKLKEKNT